MKSETKVKEGEELIPHEEFLKLKSDDTPIGQYRSIMERIVDRCNFIVRRIAELQSIDVEWWDFDNLNQENEMVGKFDVDDYMINVAFDGHFVRTTTVLSNDSLPYAFIRDDNRNDENSFPTAWIWTENAVWEKQVEETRKGYAEAIEAKRIKEAEKREKKKTRKDQAIASIKSKLTPEELSYIKWK